MKKVKFFSGSDGSIKELENQINDFCTTHQVVDIQYQSFPVYMPYEWTGKQPMIKKITAYSRVMVVYEL